MKLMETIKNGYEAAKFAINAKKPEILVGIGLVAGVAGIALLIKASFESKEILDEAQNELDGLDECYENETVYDENGDFVEMSEDEYKKMRNKIVLKTTGKVVKKYIVPATLIMSATGCFLGSNHILTKRNISLTAAYGTLNSLFKEYRSNVVEKYGEEEDYKLYHGLKEETITEKVIDENGNEVEKEKTVLKRTKEDDIFTFIVDSSCEKVWDKNPQYTLNNIIAAQEIACRILWAKGHLFLNEAIDMLGGTRLPSEIGYRYGWRYYKDGKNPIGDNFISFGVDPAKGNVTDMFSLNRFLEGIEENVILTFNCDGPIADFMLPEDYRYGNYAKGK